MVGNPVSLFISYARKDQALMRELENHLEPLKLSRLVDSWHDGCIAPGEEWEPQIKQNLESADIILLLISVDFIRSGYCYDIELQKAIERHQAGSACVIPIILRSCLWQQVPVSGMCLGDLQALPHNAKPISQWLDRDDAFTNIAQGLYETLQKLRQQQAASYAQDLQTYAQKFARAVEADYPLSQAVIDDLSVLQQQLNLQAEDVVRVERPHQAAAEKKYQQALAVAAEQERHALPAEQSQGEAKTQRQQETTKPIRQQTTYYDQGEALSHANNGQAITDLPQMETHTPPGASRLGIDVEPQTQEADDNPRSESDASYSHLRTLLKGQYWEAADQETYKVIMRLVGDGDLWFNSNKLRKCPCSDLLMIDRLWVEYSQSRFGFSIQKQIYTDCGAKLDGQYSGDPIWRDFGERVGWRINERWIMHSEIIYDLSSPRGYLPFLSHVQGCVGVGGWAWGVSQTVFKIPASWELFRRIHRCETNQT